MAGFGNAIDLACARVLKEINVKCYSITWQLFTTTVHATPVLKGLLINNWFPSVGSGFSADKTDITSKTGSGSLTRINSIMGGTEFFKKDGVITMSNNLHYAYRAEYEGWPKPQWSGTVGPYAMVRTSLVQVANVYRRR